MAVFYSQVCIEDVLNETAYRERRGVPPPPKPRKKPEKRKVAEDLQPAKSGAFSKILVALLVTSLLAWGTQYAYEYFEAQHTPAWKKWETDNE